MDRFPDELLLMIFQCVDDELEKIKLELVCRRWRKLILKDGWKYVRRIKLTKMEKDEANLKIERVGQRCNRHMIDLYLHMVETDSTLIRSITNHFPALKHLHFRYCGSEELNANAMETFRELGPRLRSFTYSHQNKCWQSYQFLRHFPHLLHLGLVFACQKDIDCLPDRFSTNLRSLHLSYTPNFIRYAMSDLEQMLTILQKKSSGLVALYLEIPICLRQPQQLMSRISDLKNLRFLHFTLNYTMDSELFCSYSNNILPQLFALKMRLTIQQFSGMLRSQPFRDLVHLSLSIFLHPSDKAPDNYESIGLLSKRAPKLRSLTLFLDSPEAYSLAQVHAIGSEVLKIAQNGILEFLCVPYASFTFGELDQLIRFCPNLRILFAQLLRNEKPPQISELQHIVTDQWRAGKRKYLPLRVWLHDDHLNVSWQDPFLIIHIVPLSGIAPPNNPVLEALLRDEVFNEHDGGGTPSFVMDLYS